MTVNSKKKKRSREAREARTESHREFQREIQAARLADDLGEQVGLVFVATEGMTHYEKFPDRKVVAVGVARAEYLTRTFPLNFKRQKLTEALKDEIEMRSHEGKENKMRTGAGAENKTTDDGAPINDSVDVEIVEAIESDIIRTANGGGDGDGDVELDEETDESSDEVTTETETESADDGESSRESNSQS